MTIVYDDEFPHCGDNGDLEELSVRITGEAAASAKLQTMGI